MNIFSGMNTMKKKVGVAILSSALVLTIGAGATYASNSSTHVNNSTPKCSVMVKVKEIGSFPKEVSQGGVVTKLKDSDIQLGSSHENTPKCSVAIKSKGGKVDFFQSKDGNAEFSNQAKKVILMMVKSINGVNVYSIDGGKTWSKNVPMGLPTPKIAK